MELIGLFYRIYLPVSIGFLIRFANLRIEFILKLASGVILYLLFPYLVFIQMWEKVDVWKVTHIFLVYIFIILIGGGVCVFYAAMSKKDFRDYILPVLIMNSFFLGAPLSKYVYGAEGFSYALIYSLVVTLFQFTVGLILFVKESKKLLIMLVIFIISICSGIVLSSFGVEMPEWVNASAKKLGTVSSHIMLFLIGYRFMFSKHVFYDALAICIMRMFLGLLIGLIYCMFIDVDFVLKGVIVLISSMPPAIRSYVMMEYLNRKPEVVVSSIFIGNLIVFLSLPIVAFLKMHIG